MSGRAIVDRLRLAAVVALVGGNGLVGAPAAAQSGEEYVNDTSGLEWSVSWDAADWDEVDTGGAADLALQGGESTVSFLADYLYGGDADACLDAETSNVVGASEVDEATPLDVGAGADWSAAGYEVSYEDGDTLATSVFCRTISPGESVLVAYHVAPADAFEADAPAVSDLLDTVTVGADAGTGTGSGDDTDEQTGDDQGDDTDEGGSDEAGADADAGTYVSPTYGYELAWDAELWDVEDDETLETLGRDRLTLLTTGNTTRVYYEGSEEWDGDVSTCLPELLAELGIDIEDEDRPVGSDSDVSDVEAIDDPLSGEAFTSDDERASAGYRYTYDDDGDEQAQFAIVDCYLLDADTGLILGVSQIGLEDDLGEEIRSLVTDVTETVRYDGEPLPTGTVTGMPDRLAVRP